MAARKSAVDDSGELASRVRLASNAELVHIWREALRSRGLQEATIERRAGILNEFATTVVSGRLLDVTNRELHAYKEMHDTEGATATRIDARLAVLSTFFEWTKTLGVSAANPVPKFRERYLKLPLREERKRRIEFR